MSLIKMKKRDQCFFYHSVNEKSIVGIVEVHKEHYPDPTDKMEKFVVDDNQGAKDALVQFRTNVQNLATEFDNNPDKYLPLLHPSLIESSIAW